MEDGEVGTFEELIDKVTQTNLSSIKSISDEFSMEKWISSYHQEEEEEVESMSTMFDGIHEHVENTCEDARELVKDLFKMRKDKLLSVENEKRNRQFQLDSLKKDCQELLKQLKVVDAKNARVKHLQNQIRQYNLLTGCDFVFGEPGTVGYILKFGSEDLDIISIPENTEPQQVTNDIWQAIEAASGVDCEKIADDILRI